MRLWMFWVIFVFYTPLIFAAQCHRLPTPLVLKDSSNELSLVWEEISPEVLNIDESIQDSLLTEFNQRIAKQTQLNQVQLLQRQRAIFQKYSPEEVKRFDLVISGQAGKIQTIGCLDSLLFLEHLSRGHSRENTEFKAYIMSSREEGTSQPGKIRIYYNSQSRNGSVLPDDEIESRIEKDLQSGWSFEYDLHNHPFVFDNPAGDIGGTVIPSGPDVSFYRRRKQTKGLNHSRVTNGIDVLLMDNLDWDQLSSQTSF